MTAQTIQSDTAYVPDSEDLDSDSEDLELTSDESETSITLITEEDEVSMLSTNTSCRNSEKAPVEPSISQSKWDLCTIAGRGTFLCPF